MICRLKTKHKTEITARLKCTLHTHTRRFWFLYINELSGTLVCIALALRSPACYNLSRLVLRLCYFCGGEMWDHLVGWREGGLIAMSMIKRETRRGGNCGARQRQWILLELAQKTDLPRVALTLCRAIFSAQTEFARETSTPSTYISPSVTQTTFCSVGSFGFNRNKN